MIPDHIFSEINSLIAQALKDFVNDPSRAKWWGKEHDCVNRFAHGFLVPRCSPSSFLHHATQIGIEVGVAQPPGRARPAARKDLVIWPEAWMSVWNHRWEPVNCPLVVMEWKVVPAKRHLRISAHDHKWLADVAQCQPSFVGFAVTLNRSDSPKERLLVSRFHQDEVKQEWLRL